MDTVRIKQEKLTPPATPNNHSAGISITDDLLENILGERKPLAEPIKSSNEILADLFKVFNAAPPTLDDEKPSKDSTHKKKKHKKEKKVKKEKKRSRTNSENKCTDDETPKSKKRKVKKSKKHDDNDSDTEGKRHKRHKKSKEPTIQTELVEVVKKEKIDDVNQQISKKDTEPTSHDDDKSKKDKNPPLHIQVSFSSLTTKDNNGTVGKRKIVIKNLAESTVYQDTLKEVNAKQIEKEKENEKEKEREKERARQKEKEREREKERDKEKAKERAKDRDRRKHARRHSKSNDKEYRRGGRSRSSSLSLSDEETYLRERERYRVSDANHISHFNFEMFSNVSSSIRGTKL